VGVMDERACPTWCRLHGGGGAGGRVARRGRSSNLTEQFFVRVNVTGEFPFVLTGLQPFFER
jgi:hypothetical protein